MSERLTIDDQIAKGMGRNCTVGGFSSGLAGGGAAFIVDLDRPMLAVAVPAGVCIQPFSANIQCQTGVTVADNDETEAIFAVDSLGMWTGDGANAVITPSNLRTDLDKGSACRVGSVFTGDMTTTPGYAIIAAAAPAVDFEIDRIVMTGNFGDATFRSELQMNLVWQPENPPYIVGPSTLLVYMGGTIDIVGGFCQVCWIEGSLAQMLPAV